MPTRTTTIALAALACSALVLSGCSSASPAGTSTAPQPGQTATAPGGGGGAQGGRGPGRMPGAFGLIADVTGNTAQVQGNGSQTAVTWSDTTTFTHQVAGTTADITVGSCVVARSAGDADPAATTVAASTMTVSDPVDGQCTGFGGGFGERGDRPAGDPPPLGQRPSGMPTSRPSGAPSGAPGALGQLVVGTVEAVGDGTITVSSMAMAPAGASQTPTTQTVTVTLGSTVTITTSQKATADAVTVGRCAQAQGETDSTGAVAATTIRVSDAVDGSCTVG